ncbi:MAG: (Fe-S)-binding protein [Bacillota bacterium]|nr:(Fe-S)-binding protein [Bacillota bacterium]
MSGRLSEAAPPAVVSPEGAAGGGLDLARARELFEKKITRQLVTYFHACAHCGLCNDTCHYYLATGDPRMVPAYKADRFRRVYKRYHDWLGRLAPRWVGAEELSEAVLLDLADNVFGACTMCRRCTVNCPMGVDMGLLARAARGMLDTLGLTPKGLKATVDVHLRTRNNMGISEEDFADTIEWLGEQLQDEVGDSRARIPLNKKGARMLYTLNPREPKYFPLTILAAAKIMYAAGEDWTLSTNYWDVTNYALFSGNDEAARTIAGWLRDEAVNLGVQEVVMAECGHGYRSFRWEGPNWLRGSYPFRVRGFVELMAGYVRDGRIRLDPARNGKPVTYHDPCNQARSGGVIQEPRYILHRAVADFREMNPHGAQNFCCGGGGGMLSMTEFAERRIRAGKVKADQIRATGAEVVATSCHNCLDQITELNKHYKLGVRICNLCEVVAEALVL